MTVKDIIIRMEGEALVTVADFKKGEILIDCDTCDRIKAFDDLDAELHAILKCDVIKIEAGQVFGDIILSIVR